MSPAILFGLLAAACYGTANFTGRFSGKALGVVAMLFWSQLFLLVCTTVVFVAIGKVPKTELGNWWLLGASNLSIIAGTACLYAGLTMGRLSVVAPVMASYGALTSLLSLLTGERISLPLILGLSLTIIGAVLSALPSQKSERSGKSGLPFALGCAVLYGVGYWLQGKHVIPIFGPVATIWLYYTSATTVFATTAVVRHVPVLTFDSFKSGALLVVTAALSGGGFGAMMIAQNGGDIAIATALSSTATAITVILAFTFLKEKPGWTGWLGVAAVVAGIAILQPAGA